MLKDSYDGTTASAKGIPVDWDTMEYSLVLSAAALAETSQNNHAVVHGTRQLQLSEAVYVVGFRSLRRCQPIGRRA